MVVATPHTYLVATIGETVYETFCCAYERCTGKYLGNVVDTSELNSDGFDDTPQCEDCGEHVCYFEATLVDQKFWLCEGCVRLDKGNL